MLLLTPTTRKLLGDADWGRVERGDDAPRGRGALRMRESSGAFGFTGNSGEPRGVCGIGGDIIDLIETESLRHWLRVPRWSARRRRTREGLAQKSWEVAMTKGVECAARTGVKGVSCCASMDPRRAPVVG